MITLIKRYDIRVKHFSRFLVAYIRMDLSNKFSSLEATHYIIEELPHFQVFNIQLNKLNEINFNVIYEQTGYIVSTLNYVNNSVEIKFVKLSGNQIDRINRIIK